MPSRFRPGWRRGPAGLSAVWFVVIGAILVLNLTVVVILLIRPTGASNPPATAPQPWTAVLLTDNEIFFGHVKAVTSDQIELTNVYFVQKPAAGSSANTPLSIVGLVSNQLQCPKDEIKINRSNVLYWEDLQDKSYVAQKLNSLVGVPQNCFQPTTPTPRS